MPFTWTPPTGKCPKNVTDLKAALTVLAKKKTGKQLISKKFTDDHVFAGHTGNVTKMGAVLAGLREKPLSTLMTSLMDTNAQKEVLNWIKDVPTTVFTLNGGTWTIANHGGAVEAENSYNFATVDYEEYKTMKVKQPGDIVSKSRKWLTETQMKKPKVACVFDVDGTPIIYHLDF